MLTTWLARQHICFFDTWSFSWWTFWFVFIKMNDSWRFWNWKPMTMLTFPDIFGANGWFKWKGREFELRSWGNWFGRPWINHFNGWWFMITLCSFWFFQSRDFFKTFREIMIIIEGKFWRGESFLPLPLTRSTSWDWGILNNGPWDLRMMLVKIIGIKDHLMGSVTCSSLIVRYWCADKCILFFNNRVSKYWDDLAFCSAWWYFSTLEKLVSEVFISGVVRWWPWIMTLRRIWWCWWPF